MATTVQDVATRARYVLNDPGKVRWTDVELFVWLDDALRLLLKAAPALFQTRVIVTSVAGAKQTITGTARAVSVVRVVGLTPFDKAALDAFDPDWETAVDAGTAVQWAPDQDPRAFYVYPKSAGGASLSVEIIQAPAAIAALSDAIPLSDDFVGPLADYVIGMSESKDAAHVNSGRAQVFMSAFAAKLGLKPATAAPKKEG